MLQPNSLPDIISFAREFAGLMRRIDRAAVGRGVLAAEGRLLLFLLQRGKSPAEIARELAMDTGQVTRLINSLCRKEFALRSHADRRKVLVSLTRRGAEAAHEVSYRLKFSAEKEWSRMTEAQRYRLANSVYSFGHYMERIGAPPAEVRTGPPGIVGVIIHDAVRSFTNPIYGYAEPFEKDCTALFARLLESKHSILVASRGEIVVGALGMSLNPVPRIGSIEFLGTFDDQERQGIGSKLLREAVLRARSNGWVRLQVEWPKSARGSNFFAKHGWKVRSTRAKTWGGKGGDWDTWSLAL